LDGTAPQRGLQLGGDREPAEVVLVHQRRLPTLVADGHERLLAAVLGVRGAIEKFGAYDLVADVS
jgi:hypothetical protein